MCRIPLQRGGVVIGEEPSHIHGGPEKGLYVVERWKNRHNFQFLH